MQGLKGYSARQANKILERNGKFWHDESFDHWIRNQEEQEEICDYIDMNPVEAGLCKNPRIGMVKRRLRSKTGWTACPLQKKTA